MILTILLALAFTTNLFGKSAIIIFMALAFIAALYKYATQKLWRDFDILNTGFILIVLTAVSLLISSVIGLNAEGSIEKWLILCAISMMGYVIAKTLVAQLFDATHFYKIISILYVISALIVIVGIVATYYYPSLNIRISNLYATVLAMGVPFVTYMAINASTRKHLWWVGLAILCAGVYALGGRTGYVVVAVCAVTMIALYPWSDFKSAFKNASLTACSILAGVAAGLYTYYLSVGTHVYHSRVGAINMDRPASGRLYIWEKTLDKFYDHPYFGVGIKGFRDLYLTADDGNQVLHAHNIILELLVDTGLIGFILFAITILWFVMRFCIAYIDIKDKALRARYLPILIGFVGYGVACMALTSIFHTWWFLYLVLFLILISVSTAQMRAAK